MDIISGVPLTPVNIRVSLGAAMDGLGPKLTDVEPKMTDLGSKMNRRLENNIGGAFDNDIFRKTYIDRPVFIKLTAQP